MLKRGRLALLTGAVVICASLVALPATAFAAKAATRIVVASRMTVDNSTRGVTPWPKTLSAKLQKKSGTRYVAYTGTVKLYKWDMLRKVYVYKGYKRSSSPSFSLLSSLESPGRGKYRLSFAGTSTTKACNAYTTVYEKIGDTVGASSVSIAAIEGTTKLWVNVSYDLDWNAEAYDGPILMNLLGMFQDVDELGTLLDYGAWVDFDREIWQPGTVEFNYKVDSTELQPQLWTRGGAYVDPDYDPYVVTSSDVESVITIER